jgi:hypothetical protein
VAEPGFFEHVLDALEGFVDDDHGTLHASAHRRGLKVWFGTADGHAAREHYEAQIVRQAGEMALEIGFHAEHRDPGDNQACLDHLMTKEKKWRRGLGDEAEAGPFLGMDSWRRISEVWEPPDPEDPEAPIEVAARLADYVDAIEPLRVRD